MLAFLIVPFELVLPQHMMVSINMCYCKTMFVLIYFLPMLLVFLLQNLLLLPFAWLKGFYSLKSLPFDKRPFLNTIVWISFGLLILLCVIAKDMFYIMKIAFESLLVVEKKKLFKHKNMKLDELDEHQQKHEDEKAVYKNFIKSVI